MPAAHRKDCLDEVKACMRVQSPQFSLPAEYWTASSRLQSYVTTLHHTLHTFTHMLPYYTIPHLMSSTICYLLCFFVASPCSVFCLKCFDDLHLSACMFLLSSCMFLLFRFIPSSLCIFDTISVSSPCLSPCSVLRFWWQALVNFYVSFVCFTHMLSTHLQSMTPPHVSLFCLCFNIFGD